MWSPAVAFGVLERNGFDSSKTPRAQSQAVGHRNDAKNPSKTEIKQAMNGHLCRCGTYTAIIEAIQLAAKTMAKGA